MITLTESKTLHVRTKSEYEVMTEALKDAMQVFIRRQFDISLIDSTALAAIELAIQNGFTDLATEMMQDLYTETGHIALAPFNFSSIIA